MYHKLYSQDSCKTHSVEYFYFMYRAYAVEPGYNDIALYGTLTTAPDIVVQIDSSLLIITLYSLVVMTFGYNATKYSVLLMT